MSNDLIEPTDLAAFPGAPFSEALVDAAAATVRAIARWHIAPVRGTEETPVTVTVDTHGGSTLYLPTRKLVSVAEIRDVMGDDPRVLTGWRMSPTGKVKRYWWPCGFQSVEADIVHGYEECPPELLPILAGLCQAAQVNGTATEESIDDYAVKYRTDHEDGSLGVDDVLARLSLTWAVL